MEAKRCACSSTAHSCSVLLSLDSGSRMRSATSITSIEAYVHLYLSIYAPAYLSFNSLPVCG